MARPTVQTMLSELKAQGVSYRQVAKATRCHTHTLYLVATGHTLDPRYSLGRAIEDLHATLCGPQRVIAANKLGESANA